MAPILTAVELLGRHPVVSRERAAIERHTRHLARLVDDLLDIARVRQRTRHAGVAFTRAWTWTCSWTWT